ncbi:MAG: hypothetical protein AMJ43_07780 [Coxiella sp. DG_40]|nr:MAG: hypothetical protein AMJ43_07780 [Coxiella sp. DG_40]
MADSDNDSETGGFGDFGGWGDVVSGALGGAITGGLPGAAMGALGGAISGFDFGGFGGFGGGASGANTTSGMGGNVGDINLYGGAGSGGATFNVADLTGGDIFTNMLRGKYGGWNPDGTPVTRDQTADSPYSTYTGGGYPMPPQYSATGGIDTYGGVSPIGVIEPFNVYQTEALQAMAQPIAPSGFYTGAQEAYQRALSETPSATPFFERGEQFMGQASDYLGRGADLIGSASGYTQRGTTTLTPEAYESALQTYMNPYQQEVIDRALAGTREAEARRQAELLSSLPGGSSFGTTAQGVQQGLLGEAGIQTEADIIAQLNQQNYEQAQQAALNQFNQERARELQGAGLELQGASTFGSLGGTAGQLGQGQQQLGTGILSQLSGLASQGISGEQAARGMRQEDIASKLVSGQTIQAQNQKLLDVLYPELTGTVGREEDALNEYINRLSSAFPQTGSQGAISGQGMGTLGAIGGLATSLGGTTGLEQLYNYLGS